jgi:glycosyltransferase involved in cell wall biosynthesis
LSIAIRIRDIFAESALIERVRSESIRAVHERYAWNVIASQYYDLYSKNASKR